MTFAELDAVAETRRLEEWDKVAFVATCAYNANPYLKKFVQIDNPLRGGVERVEKVDLDEVPL